MKFEEAATAVAFCSVDTQEYVEFFFVLYIDDMIPSDAGLRSV